MQVQPYLNFNGVCEEAIEFYKSALGAKVNLLARFKDRPDNNPGMTPAIENKIMHASLLIGDSTVLMSDGRCGGSAPKFEGIFLTLLVSNDADAERSFGALADGGKVTMPLAKTFYSSSFGMVTDRFGVAWMIMVDH